MLQTSPWKLDWGDHGLGKCSEVLRVGPFVQLAARYHLA